MEIDDVNNVLNDVFVCLLLYVAMRTLCNKFSIYFSISEFIHLNLIGVTNGDFCHLPNIFITSFDFQSLYTRGSYTFLTKKKTL